MTLSLERMFLLVMGRSEVSRFKYGTILKGIGLSNMQSGFEIKTGFNRCSAEWNMYLKYDSLYWFLEYLTKVYLVINISHED